VRKRIFFEERKKGKSPFLGQRETTEKKRKGDETRGGQAQVKQGGRPLPSILSTAKPQAKKTLRRKQRKKDRLE